MAGLDRGLRGSEMSLLLPVCKDDAQKLIVFALNAADEKFEGWQWCR